MITRSGPGKLSLTRFFVVQYFVVKKIPVRPGNYTKPDLVVHSGLLILQIGMNPLEGFHEILPFIQAGFPLLANNSHSRKVDTGGVHGSSLVSIPIGNNSNADLQGPPKRRSFRNSGAANS